MKYPQHTILSAILLGIILSGITVSCKRTPKDTSLQSQQKITYDSLVINEDIALIKDTSGPINKLSIHFVFPSAIKEDPVLLKNVQQEFVEALFGHEYANLKPQQAIDSFYKKYKEDYLSTATDYNKAKAAGFEMQSWGSTYQTMRTDTIPSFKPDTLSFSTYTENYNGGAHGSHHTGYYNIDLKTGKMISESDIFKPGYKADLKKAIIAQLLLDNKLTKPEELIEKGFFDLGDLKPNNNFLVTKNGITYGFNEYEIAPYYMGLIKVSLSYSDISNILQK
ncbi:MAG: hypothetical protein H6Q14_632 [Bacteroidetes bacterium]|nr:hypothetical protein [Bacteroidota bacterium]